MDVVSTGPYINHVLMPQIIFHEYYMLTLCWEPMYIETTITCPIVFAYPFDPIPRLMRGASDTVTAWISLKYFH